MRTVRFLGYVPSRQLPVSTLALVNPPWRSDVRLTPKPVDLASIRANDVRSVLVYCGNAQRCHHHAELSADAWPDHMTLGELQPRMRCRKCGHRGADVRPAWRYELWQRYWLSPEKRQPH